MLTLCVCVCGYSIINCSETLQAQSGFRCAPFICFHVAGRICVVSSAVAEAALNNVWSLLLPQVHRSAARRPSRQHRRAETE